MKLSMARWDDAVGKSAGWWLIKELPGFMLVRILGGGWIIHLGPEGYLNRGSDGARQLWGEDWKPRRDIWQQNQDLKHKEYPTRKAALLELEKRVGKPKQNQLADLLS